MLLLILLRLTSGTHEWTRSSSVAKSHELDGYQLGCRFTRLPTPTRSQPTADQLLPDAGREYQTQPAGNATPSWSGAMDWARPESMESASTAATLQMLDNGLADFIPPSWRLYTYEDADTDLWFYISGEEVALDVMMDTEKQLRASRSVVGFIHCMVDQYPGVSNLTVVGLDTDEHYQGRGIATYLMLVAGAYAESRGVRTIELEDESAMQRDSSGAVDPRNLYLQLGLRYTELPPNTFMEGKISALTGKRAAWEKKYTTRGFFVERAGW